MSELSELSKLSKDTKEESWSNDIILILNNLLDNIKNLESIHKNNYLSLQILLFRVRLPIIIFSALNSILAIGLNTYCSQNITSAVNCLLSLITGILGSLELFFKVQANLELEFTTYQSLKLLGLRIAKELKLEPHNRATDGITFLNECIATYHNIFENSIINQVNYKDYLFELEEKVNPIRLKSNENLNAVL